MKSNLFRWKKTWFLYCTINPILCLCKNIVAAQTNWPLYNGKWDILWLYLKLDNSFQDFFWTFQWVADTLEKERDTEVKEWAIPRQRERDGSGGWEKEWERQRQRCSRTPHIPSYQDKTNRSRWFFLFLQRWLLVGYEEPQGREDVTNIQTMTSLAQWHPGSTHTPRAAARRLNQSSAKSECVRFCICVCIVG